MKSLAWKVVFAALYGVAAAAAVAADGAVGKAAPPAAARRSPGSASSPQRCCPRTIEAIARSSPASTPSSAVSTRGSLNDYRDYWRGFALWRRAMNGFNEKPVPTDLDADLVEALERFRSALTRHPDWDEVKCAMLGAWGNRIYIAGSDAEKRRKLLEEAGAFYKWVMAYEGENPRVLWIKGGLQMIVPSASGGDWTKAAATLRKGVAGAWKEASAAGLLRTVLGADLGRGRKPDEPGVPALASPDAGSRHGPGLCGGRPHESARVALRQGRPTSADRGAAGRGGRSRGRAAPGAAHALTALRAGAADRNNRGSNP